MNAERFVDVIRRVVFEAAVEGTVGILQEGPPGRQPDPALKALSEWYKGLAAADKEKVGLVARRAAESAVFGFLVVLDGDRVIEDPDDRGTLTLWHEKDGADVLLNDPRGESLHDLFVAK